MLANWGIHDIPIYVLLNTGCSVPLISRTFVDKWNIPCLEHENTIPIENFTGEIVAGAVEKYTRPMLLRHSKHYSRKVFEVAPIEVKVDAVLPFWCISKHGSQGTWDLPELRFSSPYCLEYCSKSAASEFALDLNETIILNPKARIIGYVSAADIPAVDKSDPLERVPGEFRQFLRIMGKEAANGLPDHAPYDMKIDLKEGEIAPWGPIYPLSELEQQTLRDWLKEMLRTGKIRRSTSPAGSPILFVPKPNGQSLHLCVDYREINRVTIPKKYCDPNPGLRIPSSVIALRQ
jgi:hypothetical protein